MKIGQKHRQNRSTFLSTERKIPRKLTAKEVQGSDFTRSQNSRRICGLAENARLAIKTNPAAGRTTQILSEILVAGSVDGCQEGIRSVSRASHRSSIPVETPRDELITFPSGDILAVARWAVSIRRLY